MARNSLTARMLSTISSIDRLDTLKDEATKPVKTANEENKGSVGSPVNSTATALDSLSFQKEQRTRLNRRTAWRSHQSRWATGAQVTTQPPTLGSQYFFRPTLLWALPTQPGGRLATVRGKPCLFPHPPTLHTHPTQTSSFFTSHSPDARMYVYVKGREEKRTRWIESGMGRGVEGEKGGGKSGREWEKPDSVGRTFIHQLHSRWH